MPAIISYKCTNVSCNFALALRVGFPVWRDDTPAELRYIPVGFFNEKYVIDHNHQEYCLSCKKIVTILSGVSSCPSCGQKDAFMKVGTTCALCGLGRIVEDEDTVVHF